MSNDSPLITITLYGIHPDMLVEQFMKYITDKSVRLRMQLKTMLCILIAEHNQQNHLLATFDAELRETAMYHAGKVMREGGYIHQQKQGVRMDSFSFYSDGRVTNAYGQVIFNLFYNQEAA